MADLSKTANHPYGASASNDKGAVVSRESRAAVPNGSLIEALSTSTLSSPMRSCKAKIRFLKFARTLPLNVYAVSFSFSARRMIVDTGISKTSEQRCNVSSEGDFLLCSKSDKKDLARPRFRAAWERDSL